MRRTQLVAVAFATLLVVSVLASGVALAKARGSPELSVHLPNDEVTPGEDTELELYLQNTGDVAYADSPNEQSRVTTARAVEVTLEAGRAPIEVRSGTQPIGNLPEGVSEAVPISISVDDDAEPGEYTLPLEVEYTYTQVVGRDGSYDEQTRTRQLSVSLVVEDDASFRIVDASADDLFDSSGPVELTIENTGSATARNANVAVESGSEQLTFGGSGSASTYVGDWEPGETQVISLRGRLADGADSRSYPLTATVNYDDADGDASESEALSTGVTPQTASRFSLQDVESTLRVGEEGRVTGTLVNEGGSVARNAVLVLSGDTRNLEPIETEYSVGDLEAGGATEFSFDVEVSEAAAGGPRQLEYTVRYRDSNNEVVESDQLDARVDVGPDRPTFTVAPADATLEAGSSGQIRLEVTNNAEEPLTSISAKLFANAPISTGDDEAFIDRLEPGETREVAFGVSAAGSAMEKTYPVSLDFQYDDADGDTLLSNTHQVPVQVTQPEDNGGGMSILLIVALVVVLGAAAYYLYRRRQPA